MSKHDVLGHIDCACCGSKGSVRVTRDKNGEPFGFCENDACFMQYRFGGRPARVATFRKRYPWAAGQAAPVTATAPEPEPDTAPGTVTVTKPKRSLGVFDALMGA